MAKKKSKQSAARRKASAGAPKKSAISYRLLEAEINRLSDLLKVIKKKSVLVRRSLAYLDREQKRVKKQLTSARTFLLRLKNRGMQALQNFPQSAEELYGQLKAEFGRLSRRWVG
ncbi:MAG TPA: hypothetical protein DF383_09440 [Deltaproteobacteria bacterium]|nr:hypothetical protein [Deltaproteobacteria bacterium]